MLSRTPANSHRSKAKHGDWICLKCSNYNYSFRNTCNRCCLQEKYANQYELSRIGTAHYGEQAFPSVLFLQVDRHGREIPNYEREERKQGQDFDKENIQLIDDWHSLHKVDRKHTQKMKDNNKNRPITNKKQQTQYRTQTKDERESDVLTSNLNWINKLIA